MAHLALNLICSFFLSSSSSFNLFSGPLSGSLARLCRFLVLVSGNYSKLSQISLLRALECVLISILIAFYTLGNAHFAVKNRMISQRRYLREFESERVCAFYQHQSVVILKARASHWDLGCFLETCFSWTAERFSFSQVVGKSNKKKRIET